MRTIVGSWIRPHRVTKEPGVKSRWGRSKGASRKLSALRPAAVLLIGLAVISAGPLAGPAAAANPPSTASHGLGALPTPGLPQGISAAGAKLVEQTAPPPNSVNLSAWDPPVGDQDGVGSCMSWATGYYYRYWLRNHALGETSTFAPMYLYSQISKGVDNGSTFPQNFNIMQSQGIDHEADYSQGDYDYTTQPTPAEVTAAAPYKVTSDTLLFSGASSANQSAVEASLAAGKPVVLAIPVYPNFEAASPTQPLVDVPSPGMTSGGGHAVFVPRYDSAGVWIENSWGTSWGQGGWAELSWAFVDQYAWEGWNMSAETGVSYHALTPTRILDSRTNTGFSGPLSPEVAETFQVTGVGGVPSNATAVTGNLTVTAQTAFGYLYIGPTATNNPTSSTLNFPTGDDRANAVTVALSSSGTLSVTYVDPWAGQSAQAIFDVTGYFTPDASGATYFPLAPTRLLDSRVGTGLSGVFHAWTARTFQVSGVGGVPAGATAVTGNLTVTDQSASGYLYMGPIAMNVPSSSTLNFPTSDNRANAVTVALGGGGTLSVTYVSATGGATTDVVFDVTGYFSADASGALYVPLNPARILDSRNGTGFTGPLATSVAGTFAVTGQGGVPAGATAVTGNLTVTQQDAPGYLYLGPVATNSPTSSTLNFPLNDDRANAVAVALGAGGTLSVTYVDPWTGHGAQAIFDVSGYFVP
jgi:hypothetical protein